MNKKLRAGILGATGMVGQRFITLLSDHPWFEISCLAASVKSADKKYIDAVSGNWKMDSGMPEQIGNMVVKAVEDDFESIIREVDFVFCALDLEQSRIADIELRYARAGVPVISNNSAHRWTEDVPMIIPEINPTHAEIIDIQRKNRNFKRGFIAVKPNCSIQTYVGILTALKMFQPEKVDVVSLQAISGAGKTFKTWPEMVDNVIPFIGGEEEKSENEPLKIWGEIKDDKIVPAQSPVIAATCIRVPVSNGHLAKVSVKFSKKPTLGQILEAIANYENPLSTLNLPSAPQEFITYQPEENRPQTRLDRDYEKGMGITMGRLREEKFFDISFIALSHNTIRGAAGGAVLMAEYLKQTEYITYRP
jgi:aspartate-semialdehyde dehydrogenase